MTATNEKRSFKHVMCLVDGSEASCRAAEHATQLALALNAQLSFLALGTQHARDEGYDAYARMEGVSDPMPPTLPDNAGACLDIATSIATKLGVQNAERIIRTGDAAVALCDVARLQGADLVVVRRRKPGFVGLLLGMSDVESTTRGCSFAVLSVG